jgi:hypothetical protein
LFIGLRNGEARDHRRRNPPPSMLDVIMNDP